MTFPLNEMYGYSRLCDRLRSSAIIWKQLSLRSSAIYDLRSAIVCDRLRSYGNQPLRKSILEAGNEGIMYKAWAYWRDLHILTFAQVVERSSFVAEKGSLQARS